MEELIKNRKVWLLAGLIFVLFSISLVMALMTKSTPKVMNEFVLAEVECTIHENVTKTDSTTDQSDATAHTRVAKKTDVTVENKSNINAYIRVRLVSYYVDQDNKIVGKNCSVPTFVPNSSYWIVDSAQNTYYYKYPVAAGGLTEDLLASGSEIVLGTVEGTDADSYEYLYQVVVITAEAVQAEPQSAVSAIWSVTVGADGTLSK